MTLDELLECLNSISEGGFGNYETGIKAIELNVENKTIGLKF